MNSAIYDAHDALETLLAASSPLTAVFKGQGTPMDLATGIDAVWISGEVDNWNEDYRETGLQSKDETFIIRVHCLATVIGDFKAARAMIKTYGQAVEAAVIANHTLTGTVNLAQIKAGAIEETRYDDRRHQALLTLYVNCYAYLV